MIIYEIKLDARYKTKKGFPIVFKIHESNKSGKLGYKFIKLGIYLDKKTDWNNGGLNKKHPEYRSLNTQIINKEKEFIDKLNYCNENNFNLVESTEYLKSNKKTEKELEIIALKKRLAKLEQNNTVNLLDFFDTVIEEKKLKKESISVYNQTKRQLLMYYNGNINMNELTYEWLLGFVHFKKGDGESGIQMYLRTIRAVYKEAQRRTSLNVKKDNPFLGVIKSVPRKKDIVILEDADFEKFLNFEPHTSTTNANRFKVKRNIDIWYFQFLIGGHDFIDISLLKWANIRKDRLKFKRYKNKNKATSPEVDIMLFDKAKAIIDKYGDTESDRIFSFIPNVLEHENKYKDYRSNVNRRLKGICKNLGITPISTKTPRYTFRTRAGNLGINTVYVEEIQGHTHKGVTFNYQQKLKRDIIDEVHKKIIDF